MGIRADTDLYVNLTRIIERLDRTAEANVSLTPNVVKHISATLEITRDAHRAVAEFEALTRDRLAEELAQVTPLHSIRVPDAG